MTSPTKADWKLFQARLPQWKERFLTRLCDEYAAILSGPYRGSDAFWVVKRHIRKDMKRLEAMADMGKKEMPCTIADLLREQAITVDDLSGFSDELKEAVEYLMRQ